MSWKRPNIGSRMNREVHVRFWERLEVKLLRATRHEDTRRPRDPRDRSSSVTGPRCGRRSGTPGKPPRRGRRPAKRNNLADKLMVKATALADLTIAKAAIESERRKVDADLGTGKQLL